MITTQLRGAREIERVLRGLPRAVSEDVLRRSLRVGANLVRKEAVARAPMAEQISLVNKHYLFSKRKYGHLRDNIRVTQTKHRMGAAQMTIHTGRAFWGMFLEFGTVKMAARPWLGPAFEATHRAALALVGERLALNISKAAAMLAAPRSRWTKAFRRRVAR